MVFRLVNPPIFWNAFVDGHRRSTLNNGAAECFAWLLYNLIVLRTVVEPSYLQVARDGSIQRSLIDSMNPGVRSWGHKIKHTLQFIDSTTATAMGRRQFTSINFGPGGRHNNDFVDFRQICIMPTADEALFKEKLFNRRALEIDVCAQSAEKCGMYIDNLVRLYREDFMSVLREDIQIATERRSSKSNTTYVSSLKLIGVSCTSDEKSHPWTLLLKCAPKLTQFRGKNVKQRRAFLRENSDFLKQQSFGCLLVDGEIASFATIYRNERLLAEIPSVISV